MTTGTLSVYYPLPTDTIDPTPFWLYAYVPTTNRVWIVVDGWYYTEPSGSVAIVDPDSGSVVGYTSGESSVFADWRSYYDLKYDAFSDRVYLMTQLLPSGPELTCYESGGAFVWRTGSFADTDLSGMLVNPANGEIYMMYQGGTSSRYIQELDPADGSLVGTVFTFPSGHAPQGVYNVSEARIVDDNGFLWIATKNTTNNYFAVWKIDTSDWSYDVAWQGDASDTISRIIYIPASNSVLVELSYVGEWLWLDASDNSVLNNAAWPVDGYAQAAWNTVRGCVSVSTGASDTYWVADVDLNTWAVVRESPLLPDSGDPIYMAWATGWVVTNTSNGDVYRLAYRQYAEEPYYTYPLVVWRLSTAFQSRPHLYLSM